MKRPKKAKGHWFQNFRFKCRVCWRWTIRRGTRRCHRIAYYPTLTKICIDCAYRHLAQVQDTLDRIRNGDKDAPLLGDRRPAVEPVPEGEGG